ncbi:MAG TPA: sugar phosphate nucleotidyltransferase [Sulfuricurvum sp.]|nr:MAG: hypothetical protein B7Y30_10400 [Campylobacterales bacterium 16-40-21]OZA02310.1 MAG: hypothetical protein B7X89_09800 [Sulfuricurvum sp. 17-40-25]HQS67280.1 sugar phosphate nucleotidyltransferase [Sulfuricurvum sp.]HQT37260.1 sugar phosphate nucleotidyltransferase [Sulfuricurvum sp.]
MILAILQARMSSSRLPGKVLKKINERPVLAYEIDRIKQSKKIEKIILATSVNSEDDALESFAEDNNIACYRGDLGNVLKRFYDCATAYNADIIVRLTGDCPIIDPMIIDDVISLFQREHSDYASNAVERSYPDGLDVEVFSYKALKTAYLNAQQETEKEHVTKYIYTHPESFKISHLKNDIDYSYIRWTLDTIDDFYFFKDFYELHKNVDFSWKAALSITSSVNKYLIESNQTLRYAMKKLEEIIDDERDSLYIINGNKVIGTLASSDIRRSLIYGNITNNDQVIKIANTKFHYIEAGKDYDNNEIIELQKFKYLPVLNKNLELIEFQKTKSYWALKNKVILMAGGLGTRLKDITISTPKPMLKIGDKPILQTIIEQFKHFNFNTFYISVNHLSEQITNYFDNGNRFDVSINYLVETEKLGTIGCLSLINETLEDPFFVMNGDVLTNVDFQDMLNFHTKNNFEITIASIEHQHAIPYGVIEYDATDTITAIEEKPIKKFSVSAGVYILNANLLNEIPKNKYYDITSLFEKLLLEKRKIGIYKINDYWVDIGRPEDFYKAHVEYHTMFGDIT